MINLDGASLTIEDVVAVAGGHARVGISAEAARRMQSSRDRVDVAMRGTTPVYALNTGVGLLANIRLEDHEIEEMQVNLIRSHCESGQEQRSGVKIGEAMIGAKPG